MMRRLIAAIAVATIVVGRGGSPAEAQEIQLTGPLRGAPAVRKLRLYRKYRFEVAPTISFTLLDEFRRTIFTGARLQYSVTDWLGLGVWGAYGAGSLTTTLTNEIAANAPRTVLTQNNVSPTESGFKSQTARLQWIAAPQVTLVPFRGKLSIFEKAFIDADAYIHVGAAFVGYQERAYCGAAGQISCSAPESFGTTSRLAVAPTFGLGLNFYATKFLSLGVEYRAFPFSWNRAGFDTRGSGPGSDFPDYKISSEDRTFKFNQMLTIAVGFSFPTAPKISD